MSLASVTITQTVVTIPTNADTTVIGANSMRKYLALINIGVNPATLNFGAAATVGQGWPLSAASVAGDAGGGLAFEDTSITQQSVHAISTSGTTLVVLEGV